MRKNSACFKNLKWVLFLFIIGNVSSLGQYDNRYSKWMANSIIQRSPLGYGSWDYVTGTVMKGFQELWISTGDSVYYTYLKNTVDNVVNSNGSINGYTLSDYNIDEVKEGCAVLFLFNQTGEAKYSTAAEHIRQQLATHPRTSEGGFWHKKVYPSQMWLDGLYMGSPFYSEYNKVFNDTQYFSDVVKQIVLMDKHSYNSTKGLFYHGWDESGVQSWADPVTGCSPSFWGRAIGWYAMAIVDVLDYLPANYSGRDSVIDVLNRLAEGMEIYQDSTTGCWYQVVDKGDSVNNYLESSVSCMITYALAKAVRMGYIDHSYIDVAKKAYSGILDQFITLTLPDSTINLTKTCATAGLGPTRDGTYHYYIYETYYRTNDGKGLGPFILASLEIENIIPPPSNLMLDTLTSDSVIVKWTDNSDNESGFLLYRTDTADNTMIFQIDSNINYFTDNYIEPFCKYYYKICAFNSTDTSVFSNSMLVQVPGPTDVQNSLTQQPAIKVFPNPLKEYLIVNMNLNENSEISAGLYSSQGQLIFLENKGILVKGNHFIKFDLPLLQQGLYFIKIEMNNEVFCEKLLKQ
ncbi:MAG: glycoside hydrolase family 88 protein [Bacteroidales bacterium]|nr:glycoside hydrolase family 88 protein [Bacteroidales bacterium]